MKLTDTFLRGLKATGRVQKHSDGGGLYLHVSPTGGKLWRVGYRFEGKQKTLSFGAYPAVGLKDARQKRDAAREQLLYRVLTLALISGPSRPLPGLQAKIPMK